MGNLNLENLKQRNEIDRLNRELMLQKGGSNISNRASVNFMDDEVKWSSKSYLDNQIRKSSPE
jgi:hypothetical protein